MPKTRRRALIIALTAALTLGAAVAATAAAAAHEDGACPGEAQRIVAEQPAANPLMCY